MTIGLHSRSVEPCGFMRLRGKGAGPEMYREIGPWSAAPDDADEGRVALLVSLLEQQPDVVSFVDRLRPGWCTAIALAEPDAVNLVSVPDGRPRSRAGLIDTATQTLALVESAGLIGCATPSEVLTFGGDQARRRLSALIDEVPAVEVSGLRIEAVPTTIGSADDGAMASLVRPEFTFRIRA